MNDNTTPRDAIEYSARERVAMYIPFCVKDRNIKPRKLVEENWRMRRVAKGMEEQGVLLMRADSAIAEYNSYLWQRADDPDVVETVAKAMYRPACGKKHAYGVIERNGMDGSIERLLEDDIAANWFIAATLTALLGPRPAEQGEER